MRFEKIALKKEAVEIKYQEKSGTGDFDAITIHANDEPAPEFQKSMDDLTGIFCTLCELPKEDKARITVTAVHFSYHGDNSRLGVVISGYKKLKNYTGAVTMNTPCMLEREDKANAKKDIPEDLTELLEEVRKQAKKFLTGYRKQLKMEM